ncbi:hypothetical protein J7E25_01285 [Agromyces sp. ISL-38]|uniref:hypothetical protein n=1 Tax=Agromyces sp. ISL-38 TaxID=2819107 RepID=UPI001BEB2C8D|nr:hypothetical protein [Agromyces sp. ISL-38]MBT2497721.1 hypothetical protein [Agromyces sp. ISL-38]
MHDSDFDSAIAALTGNPVTPSRIDAAERHLGMLSALRDEVRDRRRSLVPRGADGWRSTAADRYLERLDELRGLLEAVLDSLESARSQLADRVSGMHSELEAREAAVRAEAERAEALRESLARSDAALAERGNGGIERGAAPGGATAWTTR